MYAQSLPLQMITCKPVFVFPVGFRKTDFFQGQFQMRFSIELGAYCSSQLAPLLFSFRVFPPNTQLYFGLYLGTYHIQRLIAHQQRN